MEYQDLKMMNNIHVYLDISIDDVKCGRVVIELFNEHVPKTAENFRALCTGEKGIDGLKVPLHYKNSLFHKAVPECIVQGGDITNHDGTGGESIYGRYFEDERLDLVHNEKGLLSMANCGMPHTNSSQFCITLGPTPHLDGRHVVFGRVVKGYDVVNEISYRPLGPGDRPLPCCKIWDCGELAPGQDWGVCDSDFSDVYPPYPSDWDDPPDLQVERAIQLINDIKSAGNTYFKNMNPKYARHKYLKALRYIQRFQPLLCEVPDLFERVVTQCRLNTALACTQLGSYREAVFHCNQVPNCESNAKALYRRAVAHRGLNDHGDATRDLECARRIAPDDPRVAAELRSIRTFLNKYQRNERLLCSRMFRT